MRRRVRLRSIPPLGSIPRKRPTEPPPEDRNWSERKEGFGKIGDGHAKERRKW